MRIVNSSFPLQLLIPSTMVFFWTVSDDWRRAAFSSGSVPVDSNWRGETLALVPMVWGAAGVLCPLHS